MLREDSAEERKRKKKKKGKEKFNLGKSICVSSCFQLGINLVEFLEKPPPTSIHHISVQFGKRKRDEIKKKKKKKEENVKSILFNPPSIWYSLPSILLSFDQSISIVVVFTSNCFPDPKTRLFSSHAPNLSSPPQKRPIPPAAPAPPFSPCFHTHSPTPLSPVFQNHSPTAPPIIIGP